MSTVQYVRLSDTIPAGTKWKLVIECEEWEFAEVRLKWDRWDTLVLFLVVNVATNLMEENSENPSEYGMDNLLYAIMSNVSKSDIATICKSHPIISKMKAKLIQD